MSTKKNNGPIEIENPIEKNIQSQTVLPEGVLFKGDFEAKEPMMIHGTVQGGIKSKSDVTFSAQAKMIGNIEAENMTIAGKAEGNIQCKGMTEMTEKGGIKGDLHTSRFIMSEEALFEGKLIVNKMQKHKEVK